MTVAHPTTTTPTARTMLDTDEGARCTLEILRGALARRCAGMAPAIVNGNTGSRW